jgi:hypothetical protein
LDPLSPRPGAPPASPVANRIGYLTLQSATPSAAIPAPATAAPEPVILTCGRVVPKHIVGGVYKPTDACSSCPTTASGKSPTPDPDRDFVRHIADHPPVTFDTPIIKDLD